LRCKTIGFHLSLGSSVGRASALDQKILGLNHCPDTLALLLMWQNKFLQRKIYKHFFFLWGMCHYPSCAGKARSKKRGAAAVSSSQRSQSQAKKRNRNHNATQPASSQVCSYMCIHFFYNMQHVSNKSYCEIQEREHDNDRCHTYPEVKTREVEPF
jgi:hypothetical protein